VNYPYANLSDHANLGHMGDKSKKAAHKKDVQKHAKDDSAVREQRENTETQHHPTSGHTATRSHPTAFDEPGEKK
jgi:hypothetical protein